MLRLLFGEEPMHLPPLKGWWCKFIQSHRLISLLGRVIRLAITNCGFLLQIRAWLHKGTPPPPLSTSIFHITEEEIIPVVCLLKENSSKMSGKALNWAVTILILSNELKIQKLLTCFFFAARDEVQLLTDTRAQFLNCFSAAAGRVFT